MRSVFYSKRSLLRRAVRHFNMSGVVGCNHCNQSCTNADEHNFRVFFRYQPMIARAIMGTMPGDATLWAAAADYLASASVELPVMVVQVQMLK